MKNASLAEKVLKIYYLSIHTNIHKYICILYFCEYSRIRKTLSSVMVTKQLCVKPNEYKNIAMHYQSKLKYQIWNENLPHTVHHNNCLEGNILVYVSMKLKRQQHGQIFYSYLARTELVIRTATLETVHKILTKRL